MFQDYLILKLQLTTATATGRTDFSFVFNRSISMKITPG